MLLKNTILSAFSDSGVKIVSKTDKAKAAYVLNKAQVGVLTKAGFSPSSRPTIKMCVLGDVDVSAVRASYYHSVREGSGRAGEPRLGTEIISDWLEVGDEL